MQTCGLNPADWALCSGLFAGELPRGIGLEVSGTIDLLGDGVTGIAGGPVDLALDAAPISNALPSLVNTVKAPENVLTLSDFSAAERLGVRFEFDEDALPSYDMLGGYAQLASERRFTVPVARTFSLEDWRTAAELSQSGRARGKLVLEIS